jgi:hypothetical protein
MPRFDFLAQNPASAQIYNAAHASVTGLESAAILKVCDFGPFNLLVDVGAGTGSLMASILERHGSLRGIVFDLPQCKEDAQRLLTTRNLSARCEVASGSFFDGVPEGGDAYVIKRVLHNWDDERVARILNRVSMAMRAGGTLLVAERVKVGAGGLAPALGDLQMLVMGGGGTERTPQQFEALLSDNGFRIERIVETDCPTTLSVIQAVKIA